jgi:hypothetical protein
MGNSTPPPRRRFPAVADQKHVGDGLANDQLTDGGPSLTPELPRRVAGPPFGAASCSALFSRRATLRKRGRCDPDADLPKSRPHHPNEMGNLSGTQRHGKAGQGTVPRPRRSQTNRQGVPSEQVARTVIDMAIGKTERRRNPGPVDRQRRVLPGRQPRRRGAVTNPAAGRVQRKSRRLCWGPGIMSCRGIDLTDAVVLHYNSTSAAENRNYGLPGHHLGPGR